MRLTSLLLLLLSVSVPAASSQTQPGTTQEGESLYAERCAKCHESGVPRAANREGLRRLSPDTIRLALTTGSMRTQGAELTPAQIDSLAGLLGTTPPVAAASSVDNGCAPSPSSSFSNALDRPRWNGWGANLSQHRFQAADTARLPADQVPRLKLKWAFGFPGVNRAFAQPTVVGGRVFVGSANGMVYSLNADSGCQYWSLKTDAPVRAAISIGRGSGTTGRWIAYFGDQAATVYAVDALTGEVVWKRRVETFPGAMITGAPTLTDDTLYVATSSGEEVIGANPKVRVLQVPRKCFSLECGNWRGPVEELHHS